ncbi:MAG: tRNA (guanosine(46)-N7)-methyltransferase TrmB [Myxococcales bacterium]
MNEIPPALERSEACPQAASPVHGCASPDEAQPDWPREFGRAPGRQILELEIGPGRGAFALDHAAAHPEIDLVIVETRRSDCEEIRARARKRKLTNLAVLQGDAKLLVPRCFLPGALAALHVQFPDPWWKKRHHKRRMVDVELAALARVLLRAGGTVDFRTDVPAYAAEAVVTWEEAGFVNLDGPLALWTGVPEVLSTRERRYAATGQPVFRARFQNPSLPAAPLDPPTARTGRDWTGARRK